MVIPDGPFAGRRFRCDRQPYTRLLFDAVEEAETAGWTTIVITGPTQSGKTLVGFVAVLMYHLFELRETVIVGLPSMDMARDKWLIDIRPPIECSPYREFLPRRGGGSRGGTVESVQFEHGPTLKFMTGGGTDKSRAGFTARVVVVTEADGLDQPGATSREADKLRQLFARTEAYGSRARHYTECTVSTADGWTWSQYQDGTRSRIVILCPHCSAWVSPEREHLVGWQDAEDLLDAEERSAFGCPDCGGLFTEEQRARANLDARLVHRGQEITPDGEIVGQAVRTRTLGFRWSAFHNQFTTAGLLGLKEYRATRATDPDLAERAMRQFMWCLPYDPLIDETTPLEPDQVMKRVARLPRGLVPDDTEWMTMGIDVGKWLCHWFLVAWRSRDSNGTGHVVDYGIHEVHSRQHGVERALLTALRELRELAATGWTMVGGQKRSPDVTWIDSGYQTDSVYAFCREAGRRWMPAKGYGAGQDRSKWYTRPKRTGNIVRKIGEAWHLTRLVKARVLLAELDADHWKSWVHERLGTPLDETGAVTFFHALPRDHRTVAMHLTAERRVQEFVPGRGEVIRWERLRRANHWLDAAVLAAAAANYCGVRLIGERVAPPAPARPRRPALTTPDGRPYLATER